MITTADFLPQALSRDIVAKQAHIGALKVTGSDAQKFLQGQVTCDLNKLSDSSGLYGAICNVKGRIISNFLLVQNAQDILMLMSADVLEKTLTHLKKYAVFFKVELTNASTDYVISSHIQTSNEAVPAGKLAETFAVTTEHQQQALLIATYPMQVTWRIQAASSAVIDEHKAHLATPLQLLLARPLINAAQSEETLPQWLNMQSNGGISFTKGCYTGQEIIARMQYRGKSKKQMALICWQGDIHDALDIVDDKDKVIGSIFNHATIGQQQLAQVILNAPPEEIEQAFYQGQAVNFMALPYELD